MNYKKIYDELMKSRLALKKDRYYLRKSKNYYYEGHHIVPKYLGGSGISSRGLNDENIVYLTAREHFLAHWLLWRINRDRPSSLAFHKMLSINKNQKERIKSSYGYEEARLSFIQTNIGNKYSLGVKKIISKEQRENQSKKMKGKFIGNKNPFYNKKHSEETKKNLSELAKKRTSILNPNHNGKRVVIKNDIILGEFNTNNEVSNFTGCTIYGIKNVLSGCQKTTKGYKIVYKNKMV